MTNGQSVYRDFVYLDVDRVQSIIAQLEEGLLTELISGGSQGARATVTGATAGILSQFLSIGGSVGGEVSSSTQQSKVLHDYAYAFAFDSLRSQGFAVDSSSVEFHSEQGQGTAFATISGTVTLIDYGSVRQLADHEEFLESLSSSPQQGDSSTADHNLTPKKSRGKSKPKPQERQTPAIFGEVRQFIDVFYGDIIQVIVEDSSGQRFRGILERAHLREPINHLIFKYGSNFQGHWTVLAEITRIPSSDDGARSEDRLKQAFHRGSASPVNSPKDGMDQMVAGLNSLTEFMGSVSYPEIAISPVAVFRETSPRT